MTKQLEQNYAVRDKQDVLAMCALHFASKTTQSNIEESQDGKEVQERLLALEEVINNSLG